ATFLERTDYLESGQNNADLSVVISTPPSGNNRFLVQRGELDPKNPPVECARVAFTKTPLLAVLDTGLVGIGTDTPDELLEIASKTGKAYLHLHDDTDKTDLYVGADKTGGVLTTLDKGDLRFRTG